MGKCLVTKLNGVVDNNSILRIGEIRFKVDKVDNPTDATQVLGITVNAPSKMEIIGKGYFTDKTLSENKGKSITIDTTTNGVFVSSTDNVEIALLGKYAITNILPFYNGQASSTYSKNKALDINNLKYSLALTKIILGNSQVYGDIKALENLTALTNIDLNNSQVYGDIKALENLVEITNIQLQNTKVKGNISSFSNLTKCTEINLYNCVCYGDISSLQKLTKLSRIIIPGLSGNLSYLASMSELKNIETSNSTLTGDIATLPSKVATFTAHNNSATFSWSSRSSSSTIISIVGSPVISNIDKMLQDQANCIVPTTNYKIIEVTGTRTSASDAAVATLQSKGYTVSITPA